MIKELIFLHKLLNKKSGQIWCQKSQTSYNLEWSEYISTLGQLQYPYVACPFRLFDTSCFGVSVVREPNLVLLMDAIMLSGVTFVFCCLLNRKFICFTSVEM